MTELVRPWRGVSPEQRVAERRERLLAAALEVFTSRGYAAARVSDVCAQAGLTQRYFYESFADKETALVVLAQEIVADFVTAAGPWLEGAAGGSDDAIDELARAVVRSLTDDPRRARILFVEVVGVSPALEDIRRTVIAGLVEVTRTAVAGAYGDWARASLEIELIARSLVGAAQELLIAYIRGELPITQDELAEHVGRVLLRARPIIAALAAEHTPLTTEHP